MIKPLSLFTLIILAVSCSTNKDGTSNIQDIEPVEVDLTTISKEKQKLVDEITVLQKDLEEKRVDRIPDYLDSPKRIEEIELSTKNAKIRNAIESNSSRLATDFIKEQFDLIYTEMDLNLVNEALKTIPKNELLTRDQVSTTIQIDECEYQTDVLMKDKEVKFNIKSLTPSENCKKDQQWKFISNDEFLVLDRRYYL